MDTSQRGIDFIVSFEGKKTLQKDGRYKSYLDTLAKPNVWTVYCGLTKGITRDTLWSVEQCENAFRKELAIYEDAVEQYVKVPLNQNQFDALVSFTYNCGVGALKGSTMLRLLNQGKYAEVPGQLARWNKAGGKVWAGLTRRRAAEGSLFMEPMPKTAPVKVEEGDEIAEDAMPQRVEESKGSVKEAVAQSWTIRGAVVGLFGGATQAYEWAMSGATEAGQEALKLKTTFGPWEALFAALKANMGLLAASFVLIGCGVVIFRRLHDARELGK